MKVNARSILLTLAAAFALLIGFVPNAAAITRSRDAKWEIRTQRSGQTVKRTVRSFTARGQCGSNVPNRCRERAKALGHECMWDHWQTRWNRTTPEACYSSNISGYCIKDLKCMLEKAACQNKAVGNDAGTWQGRTFEVWAITSGPSHCGRSRRIYSSYGDGHPGGGIDCSGVFNKSCCTGPCGAGCEITPNLSP